MPISYFKAHIAGWSSLVARRAHNPKVRGSNPLPATKTDKGLQMMQAFFIDCKPLRIGNHLQKIVREERYFT